jgi:hypothetical protein
MMLKQKSLLIACAIAIVLAGALLFLVLGRVRPPVLKPADWMASATQGACPGKEMVLEMNDPYMRGIVEKGQKFKVTLNWYACHPIRKGDYVLYRVSAQMNPVVRIVRAVPGDRFELERDKAHDAWNLLVNGEKVMSEGKPHFFGGSQPPTLSLYVKQRGGFLGPQEIILFSSWAPGDTDSSVFGLLNLNDVLGKVEAIK